MMKKNVWAPLLMAALLLLSGCKSADYKAAVEVYEAGDYAAAAEAFRLLDDYKDSAALVQDCEAQLAAQRDAALRESLPGLWVCEGLDMTEEFMAALPESGGETDLYELCELPVIRMDLELKLGEDGSFALACCEEDVLTAEKAVTEALKEGVQGFLLSVVQEVFEGAGMSMEEACARSGATGDEELLEATMAMSMEEIYAAMGLEELATGHWQRDVSEGSWLIADGVLTLNDAEAVYDAAAETITLDGHVYTRK